MSLIDKMKSDGTWDTLNKREKLFKSRQREKLENNFGSIADMTRQPAAIFIVDILKEHIALAEARRLNIPTFAMVDTNSNQKLVDFPIPANDDATKSITLILDAICAAIKEGLEDRKNLKATDKDEAPAEVVAETQAEVVAEAQVEVVAEAQAEAPAETQAEVVAEAQVEVVAEAQAEAPAEAQVEVVAEAPTEDTSESAE